jgi:hypothetical protein
MSFHFKNESYRGGAFFKVIFFLSGTFVIQVLTRFPSSKVSQDEQVPCLH